MPEIEFNYSETEKKLLCIISSRMDSAASAAFADEMDRHLQQSLEKAPDGLKVVFDLERVGYVASAFFRVCLLVAKRLNPGHFAIINCDPLVKKTFAIAGLDKVMQIS